MRIIEVVPTLEQEASGPSYSVPRLAKGLVDLGHEVRLMSAGGQAVTIEPPLLHARFERDLGETPILKTLELSSGLHAGLRSSAGWADLIHANGLWTMPTLYPAWTARRARKPLVVSPRGTLSPVALSRSRWRKRAFWVLLQQPAILGAAMLHATSEEEFADIRRAGLNQPVAVIPNGVDLAAPARTPRAAGSLRRLLYLGRLHPIKGLELLLQAWASLEPRFPDWELRLVGPSEDGYAAKLEQVARHLGLQHVSFVGPRYGPAKEKEYAAADLYVLPSLSENFGMSVAEALAAGIPVVTTTGAPWGGVVEQGCGWCTTPDAPGLERAIVEAVTCTDTELAAMGRNGQRWMAEAFSWTGISASMAAAYQWAIAGGERPQAVRIN